MFYFLADNHYDTHPGRVIFEHLPENIRNRTNFAEDDWQLLESGKFLNDCELLILNMIGGSCNIPHPDGNAEKFVRCYLENGGNVLLLHGSSAAFWQWPWWRRIVGLRWVRPGDPDQVSPSCHPVRPYTLRKCKCRHLLTGKLTGVTLPADEIYIDLEQVSPVEVLMDTFIGEGVFPQCFVCRTPWGGEMVHHLAGHSPEVNSHPTVISNICAIIEYLTYEAISKVIQKEIKKSALMRLER